MRRSSASPIAFLRRSVQPCLRRGGLVVPHAQRFRHRARETRRPSLRGAGSETGSTLGNRRMCSSPEASMERRKSIAMTMAAIVLCQLRCTANRRRAWHPSWRGHAHAHGRSRCADGLLGPKIRCLGTLDALPWDLRCVAQTCADRGSMYVSTQTTTLRCGPHQHVARNTPPH